MIRELAPIGLIPAAWIVTFATLIYPKLDVLWVQYMHYFMFLFLVGFTVLSWKEMEDDPVLDIWRKVIGAGVLFTGLGAISFTFSSYSQILGFGSLAYWFLAPGIALHYSARHMNEYSSLYKELGAASFIVFLIFLSGIYFEAIYLKVLGLAGIAVAQTTSIVIASKMDRG